MAIDTPIATPALNSFSVNPRNVFSEMSATAIAAVAKTQADKEERIAERHRILYGQKGSAPEHGYQDQKRFLRFDGNGVTGEGHEAPA